MDICEDTSYKHLEDFIQRNLSSNDKMIDEINMSIDINQLEQSLIPFISRISSNDTIKTFSSDASPHICDIDYDNSENEVIEIVDDDFVTDKIMADNKEFKNSASLGSENCLNGGIEKNPFELCKINANYRNGGNGVTKGNILPTSYYYSNNSKSYKNSCKWNNHKTEHKSFSNFKPQMFYSTTNKIHSISRKSELSSQENDNKSSKSDSLKFQNSTKGHILKENNHSGLYQLQGNVNQQLDCGNQKCTSLNVCSNRIHRIERTQQENSFIQDSVESVKQNIQERTSKSDDSDSDDELMKVPVALLQSDHNDSFESASELATHRKLSKSHPITCLSLDKIIEARKSEMEKNILLKNQELASENDVADEECRDTELLQLMKHADGLDVSTFHRDRIADLPPGLEIFDLQKCYHYFCPLHGLSLQSCGFIGEKGTLFDKKLAKLSSMAFQDMIALGVIKIHLDSTLFKEAILKYLFKFLSLHNNETVNYACQDVFLWYIKSSVNGKNRSFSWYPSMAEMIATILNYGVNITNGCPVKDILLSVEKTLAHSRHTCPSTKKDNLEFSLVMDGLNRVVETFTMFLEQKHIHIYSQEEICDFILLLCWLSLDVGLLDKLIKIKVERCIAAGLEMISASDWPDKMKYLAEQLAELGGHHRNILYVAQGLPVSERGIHLQRAVSFLAVQYLLKTESPCFVADVTPFMLLELLKLKPLHYVKDYFLLHSVVSLLDLCVGNKVLPLYRNALQEMCNIAMNTFGKIRETFQCLEETKVKDLLVRLYTKWSLLVRSLPHRKETMFTYSGSTEYDTNIEPPDDVCVSEIKEVEADET